MTTRTSRQFSKELKLFKELSSESLSQISKTSFIQLDHDSFLKPSSKVFFNSLGGLTLFIKNLTVSQPTYFFYPYNLRQIVEAKAINSVFSEEMREWGLLTSYFKDFPNAKIGFRNQEVWLKSGNKLIVPLDSSVFF